MSPPEMRNMLVVVVVVVFVYNVPQTAMVIIEPRNVISNNVTF